MVMDWSKVSIIIICFMQKVSIKDFSDLTQIGHGAFGTVYKALYTKNKRTFALKRMKKSHLQKQNMISQINNQISISTKLKHENIIKVYECFEDEQYIYLVLELAENGQLYQKLKRMGRFDENTVKKMIKEVIAAVEYLHSRNPAIVHRDIKPENLLLDKNNKIKLADFGWSNVLNKPRKTYCGTVDYLAPQMIDKSGHDDKLDIWCIGVLVYELLTGRTPFLGSPDSPIKNPQTVYDNILNVRIQFPEDFPTLAKDFVLGMIKRNPKQRMTFPEIKNHPWLQQTNETQIKLLKQPEASQRISSSQKIDKNESTSDNSKILKQLNLKIRQLEQQNLTYKTRIQQLQSNGKVEGDANEVARLMNEVRRLKVAEQINEKYKKKQQKMWDEINEKEKEIIKMKTDLKRSEDLKYEIQRLEGEKQKLVEKTKKMQKQIQSLEQKNRQLQNKLEQANSGYSQRVKNGQKITKQQLQTPQFMSYLRDQISQLTQKFEQSKQILTKVMKREQTEKNNLQEYGRLKAEQRKMKQIIRAELKEQFENEKDELLLRVRNQLVEQKQKFFKQREQLKQIYEDGGSQSINQNQPGKNTREEDLEQALKKIKELNSYYEVTINKQKNQIEDLREQLKRKK